ncbi:hypothetical protein CEXT_599781, partial [Caerostris extrusa]
MIWSNPSLDPEDSVAMETESGRILE